MDNSVRMLSKDEEYSKVALTLFGPGDFEICVIGERKARLS